MPSKYSSNKVPHLLAEAEARLSQSPIPKPSVNNLEQVLHELQVHQIALEIQNAKLHHHKTELLDARNRYADLYEFAPVSYLTVSREGVITAINLTGAELLGEPRQRLLGHHLSRYISSEDINTWSLSFEHSLNTGEPICCELKIQRADSSSFHVLITSKKKEIDDKTSLLITLTDVTELKESQDDLKHANRAYAALSEVNRKMMFFSNEDEFLHDVCEILVDQCNFKMAWIGYVQHDKQKSIKVMAQAGNGEDYLKDAHITRAFDEHGLGPSGRAVRSGIAEICQNIELDPLFAPWRDNAIKHGYLSSISIPMIGLLSDVDVFGLMTVYASKSNAFMPSEIRLSY